MKRLKLAHGRLVDRVDGDEHVLAVQTEADLAAAPVDFAGVDVITLEFPVFKDGRPFTQARVLRRQGFAGDIRAIGALFQDQVGFAIRCGFTSFDVEDSAVGATLQEGVDRYCVFYQRAVRGQALWAVRS